VEGNIVPFIKNHEKKAFVRLEIKEINFGNEFALVKGISSFKVELRKNSIKFGVDSFTKLQIIVHSELI